MVAVRCPGVRQGGSHHGFAVTATAQLRMGEYVFQKGMVSTPTEQIRCGDQHAGCTNAFVIFSHEDSYAPLSENFRPDAFGMIQRLSSSAHF